VLSKKIAAGANCVVVDIPVGRTAKVRDEVSARSLAGTLWQVAQQFGLRCEAILSDGSEPVGRGIGPALEARDVLAVLHNAADAPDDLRQRALRLAGALLELGGVAPQGGGTAAADQTLRSGAALRKFEAICAAQGGIRTVPLARYRRDIGAPHAGVARSIDNRRLAMVAKLAGAPDAKAAGVELHTRIGMRIEIGQPLYTIHAETEGELDYAAEFAATNGGTIKVG
jgi:thymidine phosphorylase